MHSKCGGYINLFGGLTTALPPPYIAKKKKKIDVNCNMVMVAGLIWEGGKVWMGRGFWFPTHTYKKVYHLICTLDTEIPSSLRFLIFKGSSSSIGFVEPIESARREQ